MTNHCAKMKTRPDSDKGRRAPKCSLAHPGTTSTQTDACGHRLSSSPYPAQQPRPAVAHCARRSVSLCAEPLPRARRSFLRSAGRLLPRDGRYSSILEDYSSALEGYPRVMEGYSSVLEDYSSALEAYFSDREDYFRSMEDYSSVMKLYSSNAAGYLCGRPGGCARGRRLVGVFQHAVRASAHLCAHP